LAKADTAWPRELHAIEDAMDRHVRSWLDAKRWQP
jgi:hypothetical protein